MDASRLLLICLTSFPLVAGAAAWERPEENLIWNFRNMYQPCVVERPGEEHPYRMWFFGWSAADANPGLGGCDAIFCARSKDLREWEIYCGASGWDSAMQPERWTPVMVAGDRYYDAWHNGDPSVVCKDGAYFMAYSATSKVGVKPTAHLDGMLLCIMGATSGDGIHWSKTAQPLLVESQAVQQAEGEPKEVCDYHRPSLMWDEGKWKLWFDYWCPPNGICLGYAENAGPFEAKDGFQWKHNPRMPLLKSWPNPAVVRVGSRYHCFADPSGFPPTVTNTASGRSWSTRQLCEAVSDDGLSWRIIGFIPPDKGVPANQVPQALLTKRDGNEWLYLFYATQKGTRFKLNPGEDYDYRYAAIRAMRRPVPASAFPTSRPPDR